jgi:hypothetical protein
MRMNLLAVVVGFWAFSSVAAAAKNGHSGPRPHQPSTRHANHASSHTTSHHAPVHRTTVTRNVVNRSVVNTSNTAAVRLAPRSVQMYPTAIYRIYPNRSHRYGSSYTFNRYVLNSYRPYRSVQRRHWVNGVVVSTRRGTNMNVGTVTIRLQRRNYARRLGGQINGQVALLGTNRSAALARRPRLRTFQVAQSTRFLPGRTSFASVHRGQQLSILPHLRNTHMAGTVQVQSRARVQAGVARNL